MDGSGTAAMRSRAFDTSKYMTAFVSGLNVIEMVDPVVFRTDPADLKRVERLELSSGFRVYYFPTPCRDGREPQGPSQLESGAVVPRYLPYIAGQPCIGKPTVDVDVSRLELTAASRKNTTKVFTTNHSVLRMQIRVEISERDIATSQSHWLPVPGPALPSPERMLCI